VTPCSLCGSEIDESRVEFLQETGRAMKCLACSGERPKVCLTSYDHKTAGHLVIVGTDPEQIRLAKRAYRRER
jgi:hypothetical protein